MAQKRAKPKGEIVIRWEGHEKGWRAYWHKEGEVVEVANISRHSPTGFNIGYGGSGPAALAESILALWGGGDYQSFKWEVIAKLDPQQKEHRLPAGVVEPYIRR